MHEKTLLWPTILLSIIILISMVSVSGDPTIIEDLSTNGNGPTTNNEHYLNSRGPEEPGQPRNATINFNGVRVEIEWDLPSDNESTDLLGYRVYKGIENSNYTLLSDQMVDDNEYLDFNFTYGKNYYYYIVAYNQEGEGNRTAILSIKPMKPPDPPINVRVIQAINGVSISWDPPDFEENMSVVHYRINRQVEGSPEIFQIASSTLTVYLDKNILPNTTYHYYVFAVNEGGVSNHSQKVSIEIEDLSIQDEPEPTDNDDEKLPIGFFFPVVILLIIIMSIAAALVVMKKLNPEDTSSK